MACTDNLIQACGFSLCVLCVPSCFPPPPAPSTPAIVQIGCLFKLLDAKFWDYFGKYDVYFQSRSLYMSKNDSYPVLVKRIRKWSFRAWVHGADCTSRYLIYNWVNNCSFQVLKGSYIYRDAWLRCLIRYRCFLKPTWILIVEVHFEHIN